MLYGKHLRILHRSPDALNILGGRRTGLSSFSHHTGRAQHRPRASAVDTVRVQVRGWWEATQDTNTRALPLFSDTRAPGWCLREVQDSQRTMTKRSMSSDHAVFGSSKWSTTCGPWQPKLDLGACQRQICVSLLVSF